MPDLTRQKETAPTYQVSAELAESRCALSHDRMIALERRDIALAGVWPRAEGPGGARCLAP